MSAIVKFAGPYRRFIMTADGASLAVPTCVIEDGRRTDIPRWAKVTLSIGKRRDISGTGSYMMQIDTTREALPGYAKDAVNDGVQDYAQRKVVSLIGKRSFKAVTKTILKKGVGAVGWFLELALPDTMSGFIVVNTRTPDGDHITYAILA